MVFPLLHNVYYKHGIACSGGHTVPKCTVYDPKFAEFDNCDPANRGDLYKLELKFRDIFHVRWTPFFRFM